MCEGKVYEVKYSIAPEQRGTTMCEGKIYKLKNIIAPEQRGTTMCGGKKYNMQGILLHLNSVAPQCVEEKNIICKEYYST